MALITAQAIKHEGFATFFSTNRYDMGPTNIRSETRSFWNANNFINGYDRVEGLVMSKTGWTEEAGHTLVTVAERDGVTLVAVVMSSEHKQEKFEDTMALLDYGFGKFYNLQINTDIIRAKAASKVTTAEDITLSIPSENYLIENFDVTIPKNLTEHDLKYNFGKVTANSDKTIATGQLEIYYTEDGAHITCGTHDFSVMLGETMISTQPKEMPFLLKAGLALLYAALGLLVLRFAYLVMRQMIIIENRRRIRKRRREQIMAKMQSSQQRHSNTAVMYTAHSASQSSRKTSTVNRKQHTASVQDRTQKTKYTGAGRKKSLAKRTFQGKK